jgi:hypothetical protein
MVDDVATAALIVASMNRSDPVASSVVCFECDPARSGMTCTVLVATPSCMKCGDTHTKSCEQNTEQRRLIEQLRREADREEAEVQRLRDALESASITLAIGAIPMRTEELFNGMRAASDRARAALGLPPVTPTKET